MPGGTGDEFMEPSGAVAQKSLRTIALNEAQTELLNILKNKSYKNKC
jgi:hypothetical protein